MPQLGRVNEAVKYNGEIQTGHPPGLYMLSTVQMVERFSYYGMRALLVLYLTTEFVRGGFGLDKSTAVLIYGYFTGFVYFTPMLGGYIADRFLGLSKTLVLGTAFIIIGQFMLFLSQNAICM